MNESENKSASLKAPCKIKQTTKFGSKLINARKKKRKSNHKVMSEIKEDKWNGERIEGDMEFFDAYMPREIHMLSV